jgi:hypothetical protein
MNRRLARTAASAALLVAFGAAAADEPDDAPAKRMEGRYFVEAAEVMLRANDFDTAIASVSPGHGAAAIDDVAELSKWNMQQPKMTIGLNRPGKTTFQVTVHDFELSDRRLPTTFLDAGDQVITTPLLPPGIIFQRQRTGPANIGGATDDELTPNWMEDYGFIRRADYRSFDLSVHRTAYENTRFRVRWLAGIRYAQLQQKLSARMAFAEESNGSSTTTTRDFFSVQAASQTHGIGPHFGLNARLLAGKEKKWSFNAQADVALLPESTNASYLLSLVDTSAEFRLVDINPDPDIIEIYPFDNTERPVMPGLGGDAAPGDTFNAVVRQSDFTANTFLIEGTVGVSYQITKGISIGVEGWHVTWTNLLTDIGIIDSIHEEATYEVVQGNPDAVDPQLQETESVIHVPRFHRRDDLSFDGISLNLRFEF